MPVAQPSSPPGATVWGRREPRQRPPHRHGLGALAACLGLALPQANHAALTDLATAPLETSTTALVRPNILFILDDSGSMSWDYLPDWVGDSYSGTTKLYKNARFNGQYYDPAVTYTPPVAYDGTSYASMNATNTSTWTSVPQDGFGVQSTSKTNLAGSTLTYYTSVPGEYCTTSGLRTCATQSAASATYPYPAYLRWCTTSALSTCQANRIDTAPTGGSTYTYARYPTATISGSTVVPGSIVTTTLSASTTSYAYPGSSTRASTRTDCAATTCTYAEEMTNYANWYAYYRTRMQAMKSAASLALVGLGTSYRLGYMSINNNTGSDFLDIADITTTSTGQKAKFYTKLFAAKPSNSTPLRTALSTAGRYFAGKLSTLNGVTAGDPMQYACQRNYTILSTDGYWNESSNPVKIDGSTAIGDTDASETRPYLDGNTVANTLADVAQYYYATDIRSATFSNTTNRSSGTDVSSNSYSNGQQRMYTYTLGLGASGYMHYDSNYLSASSGDYHDVANGTSASSSTQSAGVCIWQTSGSCNWPKPVNNSQTAIDDLWHAAVNGRGVYYSAGNPAELKSALTDFVNVVSAATGSSASATTSAVRLTSAGSNYVYATSFCSAKWFGELARYSIDASTGVISSTPDWAESGAGTDCSSANTTLATAPLLDNLAWSTRTIYSSDPAGSNTLVAFNWAAMSSTMQGYFKVAALSGLTQMCASGVNCLPATAQVDSSSAGTTTGAGGINLVNFLRGDRSNEGSLSTAYYFPRTHVLGDVVNSQAVYVGVPTSSYGDSGYASYKANQAGRTPMVYVGANDGMLHAFNANSGTEVWAYIPSMLLPKLYKLADKAYASNHINLVDGPLTKADVYMNGAWRTVLVGGLGQGGRGYYALDVTTPALPQLLWEFTADTSAASRYIRDEDLGYTYGAPVVTQLSDGTWAVLVSAGYNNVSPGSGHGVVWVLNAATGAIIKKIDTGLGSNSAGSTVTGCSATPCPAGLARLAAWSDSSTLNRATFVYGGDLYGNLWRLDVRGLTASGGTATVQLLATLSDASGNRQPITAAPELGVASSTHMVFVGTGAYLGATDVSTTQVQSLYGIKDPLTGSSATTALYANPRSNTCTSAGSSNCFAKEVFTDSSGTRTAASTLSSNPAFASIYGWYVDLPETGERVYTDLSLVNGTLVAVSNIPTTSAACAVGGSSYLNYVDYRSGLTVTGQTDVGTLISATSLASAATVVVTTDGTIRAILALSDGTRVVRTIGTSSSGSGTRRVSWRELIVGQ